MKHKNVVVLVILTLLSFFVISCVGNGKRVVIVQPYAVAFYDILIEKWDDLEKTIFCAEVEMIEKETKSTVKIEPGFRFTTIYMIDDRRAPKVTVKVDEKGNIKSVRISFYFNVEDQLTEYYGRVMKGNKINDKIAKIATEASEDAKRFVKAQKEGAKNEKRKD